MTIEKSNFLSGNSGAIVSMQDMIDFIKNKTVETSGRVFSTDLTTEQLAGQYAYESIDSDIEEYESQIEHSLDFLSSNGIRFEYSKAIAHALALLAEEEND